MIRLVLKSQKSSHPRKPLDYRCESSSVGLRAIFLKGNYFFLFMYVFMSEFVYTVCRSWSLWRSEDCIRSPRTGVTGSCEPSDVGAGSRTHCYPLSISAGVRAVLYALNYTCNNSFQLTLSYQSKFQALNHDSFIVGLGDYP